MASSSSAAPIADGSSSSSKAASSGIPQAPFIEDVEKYLGGSDVDVAPTLQGFQEAMSKYKIMETSTHRRLQSLQEKIPDITKTLAMVEHLQSLKEEEKTLETHFELHDTLFAKAVVEPVEEVNLWLGANVMLSYPLAEAISLLTSKLAAANTSLAQTERDLDFLRDQITTMEVNTARVHNWDVKRRREGRLKAEAEADK